MDNYKPYGSARPGAFLSEELTNHVHQYGPVYITEKARKALRVPAEHCTPEMLENWAIGEYTWADENRLVPLGALMLQHSECYDVDYTGKLARDGKPVLTHFNNQASAVLSAYHDCVSNGADFEGLFKTFFTGLGKSTGQIVTLIKWAPGKAPVVSSYIFAIEYLGEQDRSEFYLAPVNGAHSGGDIFPLWLNCPGPFDFDPMFFGMSPRDFQERGFA